MPDPVRAQDNNIPFDESLRQIRDLRKKFETEKPRTAGRIQVLGWDLEYVNAPSLWHSLEVQTLARINDFHPANATPFILDCGANIGISVLNYKRQFPGARIIAFEPDPNFLPHLRKNLERNGAADVQVVEAAVWIKDGDTEWVCEGIDGSKMVDEGENMPNTIVVKTVDLASYLTEEIDLLKIDIEGAEYDVVEHLSDKLDVVKNLIVECHVSNSTIPRFGELLGTLKSAGFSVSFNTYGLWRDLVRQPPAYQGNENYVLVAAWRAMLLTDLPADGFLPNMPFPIQETIYEMGGLESALRQKQEELTLRENQLDLRANELRSTEARLSSRLALYDSLIPVRIWRKLREFYNMIIRG